MPMGLVSRADRDLTMSSHPRPLRLGIVDDHEVFRIGLRSLLERVEAASVAWDTGSVHEALDRCADDPVDAVLMDVHLGGPVDGLQATAMLVERQPGVRVILISGLFAEGRLPEVRTAGAAGFLPKDLAAAEMVQAIRALLDLPDTGGAAPGPARPAPPRLSRRE